MSKFRRPCLTCGQLTEPGNSYCTTHQAHLDQQTAERRKTVKRITGQYSGDYKRRAKQVRQTAISCHICGDPARPNDPWEADHINAGTANSELKPAHRSCNQRRGNKPIQ